MVHKRAVLIKLGDGFRDTGGGTGDERVHPFEGRGEFPKDEQDEQDRKAGYADEGIFFTNAA